MTWLDDNQYEVQTVTRAHKVVPTRRLMQGELRKKHTISVAGKLGEIVQGWSSQYGPFFVSAAVTSSPNVDRAHVDRFRPFALSCRDGRPFTKAIQAVERFVAQIGIPSDGLRGHIELERGTPEGKGRGSSSIDTYLAIRGVAEANDVPAHPRAIYSAQCKVERSDPVYLDQTLVIAEPEAGVYHVLGPQPRFLIIGWDSDPRGTVDTGEAASLDEYRRRHASEYEDLLAMVATKDATMIAKAATRSSRLNHQWLPKPAFEGALNLATKYGAGLLSAHTGTYLGLMMPPDTEPFLVGQVLASIRTLCCRPEVFLMGGK